ncbi:MAG: hypothetical protein ACYCUF_00320 [Acidimicrobiales bacterium]|nr:hypothetical protein [Actinomycetota bacterium]
MSDPEKGRSVADRILDATVFAPAGLVITIFDELPKLADKGRSRIDGQVATARVVGQFAVQMGRQAGRRRLDELRGRLVGTAGGGQAEHEPEASGGEHEPEASGGEHEPEASGAEHYHDAGPRVRKVDTNSSLAIPGYDTLSASQVVQRLAGLGRDDLLSVRSHEAASRHRRTILNRVDQLLSMQDGA